MRWILILLVLLLAGAAFLHLGSTSEKSAAPEPAVGITPQRPPKPKAAEQDQSSKLDTQETRQESPARLRESDASQADQPSEEAVHSASPATQNLSPATQGISPEATGFGGGGAPGGLGADAWGGGDDPTDPDGGAGTTGHSSPLQE